jgi:hypothetical protein
MTRKYFEESEMMLEFFVDEANMLTAIRDGKPIEPALIDDFIRILIVSGIKHFEVKGVKIDEKSKQVFLVQKDDSVREFNAGDDVMSISQEANYRSLVDMIIRDFTDEN